MEIHVLMVFSKESVERKAPTTAKKAKTAITQRARPDPVMENCRKEMRVNWLTLTASAHTSAIEWTAIQDKLAAFGA